MIAGVCGGCLPINSKPTVRRVSVGSMTILFTAPEGPVSLMTTCLLLKVTRYRIRSEIACSNAELSVDVLLNVHVPSAAAASDGFPACMMPCVSCT
jgi:hypothetical protein